MDTIPARRGEVAIDHDPRVTGRPIIIRNEDWLKLERKVARKV
jgi:hypothetical protein